LKKDRLIIYLAGLSRSCGVGLIGVILGLYLAERGINPAGIGLLIGSGLAANALTTLAVSLWGDRLGRKKTLAGLTFLMSVGAVCFAFAPNFPWLVATAFLGILNGMGRDRGASASLEQAILPATASHRSRTQSFAWYHFFLDIGHAAGGLLAVFPSLLRKTLHLTHLESYQSGFLFYGLLVSLSFFLYLGMSDEVEVAPVAVLRKLHPSKESRKTVGQLCGLFAIDSFGSGFLSSALLSYWFFVRFGVREEVLGPVFFLAYMANSLSHLASAWISRKIGLINTMVFTHIPSSILVMLLPLAPHLSVAVALWLVRECLLEMDVPTRQSYVVAMVKEEERTFASGMTNLARLTAWAVSPPFAGMVMKGLSMSSPLFIGGGIKILYDLLLFKAFRKRKPPEEA
jgi:MFS family permease